MIGVLISFSCLVISAFILIYFYLLDTKLDKITDPRKRLNDLGRRSPYRRTDRPGRNELANKYEKGVR